MKMTLCNNDRVYFDGEIHTLCNEPLEMEIETEVDNLYAVCTLDNKRSVIKVKDGVLSIPPSFLAPGELHITLQKVENGEITKRWRAERVTLRKLDAEYQAIPELVALHDEVTTLKKALRELYNIVNKNNLI